MGQGKVDELRSRIEALDEEAGSYDEAELESRIAAIADELKSAESAKAEGKRKLDELRKRRDARQNLMKSRDAAASSLVTLDAVLKQLEEQKLAEGKEIEDARARLESLGEVSFDEGEFKRLQALKAKLEADRTKLATLQGEVARLPDVESAIEAIEASILTKRSEMAAIMQELDGIGRGENDMKLADQAHDEAKSAVHQAQMDVQRHQGDADRKGDEIARLEKSMADLEEERAKAAEQISRVQETASLEKVMQDFRSNIVARVAPTLSDFSSQLFCEMTDSRYGGIELSDTYEMSILDDGRKYSVGRFSGGESDLANLCLRLAISRMLSDRSGKEINFLVLDEIFGSQDQVRQRNIMRALKNLEKRFRQIILISHIEDTKEMMSNVITVKEMEDGTSTIELS